MGRRTKPRPLVRQITAELEGERRSRFARRNDGVIVRMAPLDESEQIVVPSALGRRVLWTEPRTGGSGARRGITDVRNHAARVLLAFHGRRCVPHGSSLCLMRQRSNRFAQAHDALALFPAQAPLESVAIDLLGPLPKSKGGHTHILIIADRLSKLCRFLPMKSTTADRVAKVFCSE